MSDHYEMLGELALGGMATVYLGQRRRRSGGARLVAIKSIRPDIAEDEAFLAMFLDEATLTARIKHANVVQTLDVVSADGRLLIVMEYVEGVSLARLASAASSRRIVIPVPIVVGILADVLRGLHAAHQLVDERGKPLNVVHRDVSPQNVIVGVDGVARILDFGIAKAASQRHVTARGEIKGKIAYMPPEQQVAEPVDRRADVYAAGVVLWEMIAGRRLFEADVEDELVRQVFEAKIEPPSRLAREPLPPELDRVVLRALARKREDRWWSADEMANALARAIAPAERTAISALVLELGEPDLDERARLIDELLEQNASQTSVLEPEAQAVLDLLTTGPRSRPIDVSDPIVAPPASGQSAELVARRSRTSRRRASTMRTTLLVFALLGLVLGLLAVVGLVVWTKNDPAPEPEPVFPPPPIPGSMTAPPGPGPHVFVGTGQPPSSPSPVPTSRSRPRRK